MMSIQRDERGMTVVELVVVAALFGIVAVMLFNFLDSTTSITTRIDSNVRTEQDAQLAMRVLTQDLRAAQEIKSCPSASWAAGTHVGWPAGFANCIRFTVSRNVSGFDPTPGACPKSTFAYALVNGRLLVDRDDWNFNASGVCVKTTRHSERPVLDQIVNTASQPLFTYLDGDGRPIDPVTNAASVPTADSVRVHFVLQHRPRTPLLEFKTTVGLRNNNSR